MFETATYKKMKNSSVSNYPALILVHHTGGTDANPKADTSNHTAAIIENCHIRDNRWSGIGYHYVIHKNGEIWRGRPEHVQGAHEPAVNKKSIGICLTGNFDVTLPTQQQIDSLKLLMTDLIMRYPITVDGIRPHRTYAKKSCYGKRLSDTWARDLLAMYHASVIKTKKVAMRRR